MPRLSRRAPRFSVVMIVLLGLANCPGCIWGGEEFREVAGPAVQSGVTQIVTGLLDGLFATIAPDPSNGS